MTRIKTVADLKPVYVLYGPERFLVDEAIERLKNILGDSVDISLNMEKFSSPSGADDILNACFTPPFLSEKRLVIIEDFETLPQEEKNRLAEYIENPSHFTVFILVQTGVNNTGKTKVDKRSRLFKKAESLGFAFEYRLDPKNQRQWIKNRFLDRNKVPTEKAVEYLIDSGGSDLRRLDNEIEKISLFADSVKKIDIEHIREAASLSPEAKVFDLIESIVKGDTDASLRILSLMIEEKEIIGKVFYLLEQQIRLLIRAKDLLTKKVPDTEASRILGISPGRLYFLKAQIRSVSEEKLEKMIENLAAADHKRKLSADDPRLILERFIVETSAKY